YSIGGRSIKNIPKEIPINQNNLFNFAESTRCSAPIILSMTYFKIKGINNGIANLKIPIMIVQGIFHLNGYTNFIYCLVVFIQYSSLYIIFFINNTSEIFHTIDQ